MILKIPWNWQYHTALAATYHIIFKKKKFKKSVPLGIQLNHIGKNIMSAGLVDCAAVQTVTEGVL